LIEIKSYDNKDRWLGYYDVTSSEFKETNHQHDSAWIGGPGISSWNMVKGNAGWMDDDCYYFQSEKTGYSHLYMTNTKTNETKALTKGKFEIHEANLSDDKSKFFISANKNQPGNREFYHLDIKSKKLSPILTQDGNHEVLVSPNEKWLLVNYSFKNKPWDLYLAENTQDATLKQVTKSPSNAFQNYKWRTPPVITYNAADGQEIHARIYEPATAKKNGAAVFFVHGAGYLQNAHNWWSGYYREYMFNNLLCDKGYTVMDIDFRASKGYGRDFRTDIYRHMGGKDLSDYVDARNLLIEDYGIDPNRIGMYGGSYGGFITIMALLTEPGKFKCGAAVRSVTDWAHYNHAYTSNILNTPLEDPKAFEKSSPIYFADKLEDRLLMLHGMVDNNVQYQDVARLAQRFIELGKTDWDLVGYPIEPHGFKETSSWIDEYGRILKMFDEELR
jgi:dipeptidyl aminopeptidase/acylaminoacyl peptidase